MGADSFGESLGQEYFKARAGTYEAIPVHYVRRWKASEKSPSNVYGYVNERYVKLLVEERDRLIMENAALRDRKARHAE